MSSLATIEFTLAALCLIFQFIQFSGYSGIPSSKKLRSVIGACTLWLVFDALSYVLTGPGYPFVLRYIVNLMAYVLGSVFMILFIRYADAFIREKTELNPWLYRAPIIAFALTDLAILVEFILNRIIVYENGIATAVNGMPLYVVIIQMLTLLYLPWVAFSKRKSIGTIPVMLLGFSTLIPVITGIVGFFTGRDYTAVAGAITLILVISILQRMRMDDQQKIDSSREALEENYSRIFALQDDFESLYDVELESGHYTSYDRDEFYKKNVSDNVVSMTEFFAGLKTNIERVVYKDDQEAAYNVQKKENIKKALSEKGHIDHYYRINTENGTMWLKMRIVYKDATKKNIIVGIFNAEEEMAQKQKDEEVREELAQTNARLFALEDNFESLYDVNMDSGFYDVLVKGDFYKNSILDKLSVPKDYFEELRGNIDAVIYPEDREGLYNALTRESIRKELADNEHFDYYYRISTDNEPVWFKMRIVYKNAEKKNAIIGVFNAANDVEAKQIAEQKTQLEETLAFTNYFLGTYTSAYYINLETLEFQAYKEAADFSEKSSLTPSEFFKDITEYIDARVHPDDKETLLSLLNPENMKKALADHDDYSYIFRGNSGETERAIKLHIIKGADDKHAAFGFSDVTEETIEQNRRQNEAEESKKLIESVAASYDVAYSVNMDSDSYRLLKKDTELLDDGNKFKNFSEVIASLLEVVHASDRELMKYELSFDTIRKKLKENHSYEVNFRIVSNNSTAWHQMNVTLIDEDRVAIGFAERDNELVKLFLEEKRYDEYFALFVVDIDTRMLKVALNNEKYKRVDVGQSVPYTQMIQEFADTLDDEANKFFRQISDLDYVCRELATDDKRTFSYKSTHLEGNKWIDVTSYVLLRHEDGTPAMFTLGFGFVDVAASERQELQRQLNENMQMISGLASGYENLYYYNIDEGIFKTYAISENTNSKALEILHKDISVFDMISQYKESGIIHPEDTGIFDTITVDALREKLAHQKKLTLRFRRKTGGEYLWCEMDIIKYEDVDERANAIAIGFANRDQDIRREQEQKRALEQANKSKTEFLFNMSHDIRTPMNAITGFTNMAVRHIDNKEKVLDCLGKTQKAGSMLLSLINSVLEVSRIESGHATLEEQHGDVYYSFSNIEATMYELANTKDIHLSFEFGKIKDKFVYADFSRCMRIFVNVISNAIKYTPEGGTVKVRCEQIDSDKKEFAVYRYTVADNGIGMSEEFQKHVFEQFTRENNSTVSGIQGTGLGMAVVKSFVDLLGGTIECRSKLGEGTTFTIDLPFKLQYDEKYTDPVTGDVVSKRIEKTYTEDKDFSSKRVLLVEDNELNREIALDLLIEAGLIADDAEDGTVAVETLKEKGPDYYDFILMDIQMPKMNGYEATKAIREMYPDSKIPIIALSANAFAEDKTASKAAGMDDHVAKPINVKELFSVLEKYI